MQEILTLRGEVIGGEEDEEEAEEGAEGMTRPESAPATDASHVLVAPSNPPPSKPEQARYSGARLEKAEWRRDRLATAAGVLIAFANQDLLEHRFRKLMHAIFAGGAVVAIGAGAFAASPQLSTAQPISVTQPTQVTITVIGTALGKQCPGTVLRGVAVGGTWADPLVVIEQAGACPAQETTLDHRQAVAVPVLTPSAASAAPAASPSPSP